MNHTEPSGTTDDRKDKQIGTFFYINLILSFIIVSLLANLLFRKTMETEKLLMKNKMNGLTIQFLMEYNQGRVDEMLAENPNISALVIYEEEGPIHYTYGDPEYEPHSIENGSHGELTVDHKKQLVIRTLFFPIFEPAGSSRFLPGHPPWPMLLEEEPPEKRPISIHLELKSKRYIDRLRFLTWVQIIIQGILILVFMEVLHLYRKNLRYKKALDSQKNLVLLGTAVRTLSHEMKNPLGAIRLQSGLIRKIIPERLNKETEIIDCEVDRLSRLMDKVKDYLREPLGCPDEIDLIWYMNKLKDFYPPEVKWSLPREPVLIHFDRDRFRSIMENLLNNALESGSIPEDISVKCSREKGTVLITVRDCGKGITETIRGKIFDPFFTTKSTGTGVGLMVVKRFLEAAGSGLHIESRENMGTMVAFRLPARSCRSVNEYPRCR